MGQEPESAESTLYLNGEKLKKLLSLVAIQILLQVQGHIKLSLIGIFGDYLATIKISQLLITYLNF